MKPRTGANAVRSIDVCGRSKVLFHRRAIPLVVFTVLLLVLLWVGDRAYLAYVAYRATMRDITALQARAGADVFAWSGDDFTGTESDLRRLHKHLQRLDTAMSIPMEDVLVARLPWLGPRYRAVHDLLRMGERATDAAQPMLQAARETFSAFQATGIIARRSSASPTWLDVLDRYRGDLPALARQLRQIKEIRSRINSQVLPGRVRVRLDMLDRFLDRVDADTLVSDYSSMHTALGGDRSVRYLMLFENPSELRPGGGFPGTMGLVTIDRGLIRSYETFNAHTLTQDYIAHRRTKIPQPWPIAQYFPQDGFLLHDATWWADFPRDGAQLMAMYAETDWPPIDGVIAVEPVVIHDLLRVAGPVTVDVNGDRIAITPENFFQEIEERQRLEDVNGTTPDIFHKDLIGLIGTAVVERLKRVDRSAIKSGVTSMIAAANRRDIQLYSANPQVQSALDHRHWTGRLVPDPGVPTLAVTFGNVVTNKASLRMQPHLELVVDAPVDGRRRASLRIDLEHTGSFAEEPFYAGFQRWWVEVTLPVGSTRLSAEPAPLPDPESPNGGSYLIEIFPEQIGHITVVFSLPAEDTQLLVRRQPGVTPVLFSAATLGCPSRPLAVTADMTINLDRRCT